MAIEKARLEQLIGQGKEVYVVSESIFKGNKLIAMPNIYDLEDDEKVEVDKDSLFLVNGDGDCFAEWRLADLFETESEAEHYARFGNMVRTESLNLPSFEEFCADEETMIQFRAKDDDFIILCSWLDYITVMKKGLIMSTVFKKPLTPENYTEACELVRKLWIWERE